jgi:hypothetical protein
LKKILEISEFASLGGMKDFESIIDSVL